MKVFAIRLKPNQDLKETLKHFIKLNNIQSGFILTAVGSLKQATIRFANQGDSKVFKEKFEIVSLVGTLSNSGIHLHIAISDKEGKTIGGHLDNGCIIYTTDEIVIGASLEFTFVTYSRLQPAQADMERASRFKDPVSRRSPRALLT